MRGQRLAERVEAEREDRGGDAGAAAGDHRLVEIDAGLLERLPRCASGDDQAAVLDDLGERHVERARHVAGAQARRAAPARAPAKRPAERASTTCALLVVERHLHVAVHRHRAGVHARR